MTVSWDRLSPTQFEEFCYHLLECMGLTDLAWHGESGSDRGRDIVGQLIRPLIGGKNDISKWVVQCKRYTKGSLGRKEIDDGIIWAEAENPGYYLLITTSVLSSSNRDWLTRGRRTSTST